MSRKLKDSETNSDSSRDVLTSHCSDGTQSRNGSIKSCKSSAVWSGELLPRKYINTQFSRKVFIGWQYNLPQAIVQGAFRAFGAYDFIKKPDRTGSYAFLIFKNESSVEALVYQAHKRQGGLFYDFVSNGLCTPIQVIPFAISDLNYNNEALIRRTKTVFNTVFIGAIHGQLTARAIAEIFEANFGPVTNVTLIFDMYGYPLGSGKVTFLYNRDCTNAVATSAVDVYTSKFSKRIIIDPYVQTAQCMNCPNPGVVFCKDPECFRYSCPECFELHPRDHVGLYVPSIIPRSGL